MRLDYSVLYKEKKKEVKGEKRDSRFELVETMLRIVLCP